MTAADPFNYILLNGTTVEQKRTVYLTLKGAKKAAKKKAPAKKRGK